MPETEIKYEDIPPASHEAVHAARDAAQALEVARVQQMENLGDMVQERFEHVLAMGTEQDKTIILARVKYICQDIKDINGALKDIIRKMDQTKLDLDVKDEKNEKKFVTHDQFSPFKWGATLIATLVVTAIVGALLALVIIK